MLDCIKLGCQFNWLYFGIGTIGGVAATLTLPGCYATLPSIKTVNGEKRIYWGVFARLIVAGIAGCVADCNNTNSFFAGFFSWHIFRFLHEEGWIWLKTALKNDKAEGQK